MPEVRGVGSECFLRREEQQDFLAGPPCLAVILIGFGVKLIGFPRPLSPAFYLFYYFLITIRGDWLSQIAQYPAL